MDFSDFYIMDFSDLLYDGSIIKKIEMVPLFIII